MNSTLKLVCIVGVTASVAFGFHSIVDSGVDTITSNDLELIRSFDDGSLSIIHHRSESESKYDVFWCSDSPGAEPKLLTFSDVFPRVGRLKDGRIWIIESASGDINLRVQRASGGWQAQHHNSEDEALISLARLLKD